MSTPDEESDLPVDEEATRAASGADSSVAFYSN